MSSASATPPTPRCRRGCAAGSSARRTSFPAGGSARSARAAASSTASSRRASACSRRRDTRSRCAALVGRRGALVTGQPAIQHDLDPQLASDLRRGEPLALPLALARARVRARALARARHPVPLRGLHDRRHAGRALRRGAPLRPLTSVRDQPRRADRARARDRLLAADRLPLPRGARSRATREQAIVRTMATAGRAVVFSGLAVAIGLALLLFVPVPFIRTMGLARAADPARVDRRRADAAAGAALVLRPPRAHGRAPASRRPRAARAVGRARAHDHAPPARRPRAGHRRCCSPRRRRCLSSGSARARSPSLPRATESARGLAALRDAFGPGRADADRGRRRRRARRRGAAAGRPRRGRRGSPTGCSTTRRSTSSRAAAASRTSRATAATRASSSIGRHEFGDAGVAAARRAAAHAARPGRALPGRHAGRTPAAPRRRASTSWRARTASSRGSSWPRSPSRTSCWRARSARCCSR